jgi:methylenetetrahydrofolate dehydrogenase (NADP+)/methenyltetrahydrofolate cyclohydrolase/formyltetrahydrofolate synthetase
MAAEKIDGTQIAKDIRAGLKSEIQQIQQSNPRFKPSLVIFQGTYNVYLYKSLSGQH